MKKTLLSIVAFIAMIPAMVRAQSASATFTTSCDTMYVTVPPSGVVDSSIGITNTTTGNDTLKWHVISTNFPTDWLTSATFGICDEQVCRSNTGGLLWNGTSGTIIRSVYYQNVTNDSIGVLSYSATNMDTCVGSTHYFTVNITDWTGGTAGYSKNVTFMVSNPSGSTLAVSNVNVESTLKIYPNPAKDELNVVYDASADVRSIAVYNIIGKIMCVYKVNGASAKLDLSTMPAGLYFVRLSDSHGAVVATKKFTKQ